MRRHRKVLGLIAAICIGLTAATAGSGSSGSQMAARLDTIQPGVLTVAIEPYAPYTSYVNGKQVGLEADMLYAVANRLHLNVKTVVTDFTGMLSGIQAHRYDITTGGIAWSAQRAEAGLFTDPLYYSPTEIAVTNGKTYKTIDDLQGLNIGTVTGYVWVDGIKAIKGAKLHTYPNTQVIFDDLKAGRIDVAIIDPLLLADVQKQRPDLHLKLEYLAPPTDAQVKAQPAWSWFRQYQVAWYIPKQEPQLEAAVSKQIDAMYKDGHEAKFISRWGGSPAQFLKPGAWISQERRGVDRPKSWNAPRVG